MKTWAHLVGLVVLLSCLQAARVRAQDHGDEDAQDVDDIENVPARASATETAPATAASNDASDTNGVSSTTSSCIDESIRDELNARRRYRGVQKRLFQKAGRHELSAFGGVYASDLLSSSYLVGGAYTYHFNEDLGLEASFGYTRAQSSLVRIVEQDTSFTALRLDTPVYIYEGHLLWSLAYGKLRWFSGSVSRFDLYTAFGGGVTDNQSAQGLTGSFGLGLKLYFGDWFAVRFDVRDQILTQELLGHAEIVNNLAATLGVSVFLPFVP